MKHDVTDEALSDALSRFVKAELLRAGVSFSSLAEKLRQLGVEETESSIKGKLHRGKFSAAFLLQCMSALGLEKIELDSIAPRASDRS